MSNTDAIRRWYADQATEGDEPIDGEPFSECPLDGCKVVFCGSDCADQHLGKHEDVGDIRRDRDGEIIECDHESHEDCLICADCGRCSESLNDADECADCAGEA
jgi:hypothetical protein